MQKQNKPRPMRGVHAARAFSRLDRLTRGLCVPRGVQGGRSLRSALNKAGL